MLAEIKLSRAQGWALHFCLHKVCLSAGDFSASASDSREQGGLHPAIPVLWHFQLGRTCKSESLESRFCSMDN